MKRVLIAFDYSAAAENAVKYAASFLTGKQGTLILLYNHYTLSVPASNARLTPSRLDDLYRKAQTELQATGEKISSEYNIPVISFCGTDEIEKDINTLVNGHQLDVVVIGMADKSLEQELLGNTTTTLLSKIQTPMLAVPAHCVYNGIHKILFACDILKGVHRRVVDEITDVANDFGAEVELFHVTSKVSELQQIEIEEQLKSLNRYMGDVTYLYKNVSSAAIIEAIKEEIVTYNADVLIMTPYKYGFWSSLVHRSKTKIMASGLNIPLLSIPLGNL